MKSEIKYISLPMRLLVNVIFHFILDYQSMSFFSLFTFFFSLLLVWPRSGTSAIIGMATTMAWPYRYCDWYGRWPYRHYAALRRWYRASLSNGQAIFLQNFRNTIVHCKIVHCILPRYLKLAPGSMAGIRLLETKSAGYVCTYCPDCFAIPNVQHLFIPSFIWAQEHQAILRFSSDWALLTSCAISAASSANCNHVLECLPLLGPHIYPSCSYLGCAAVNMSELKHKLNNIGELGSPCRTPRSTQMHCVESLPWTICTTEFV